MTILLVAEHDNASLSDQTAKALSAALKIGPEVDVLVAYVGAMGKRAHVQCAVADPAPVARATLDEGKNLFVLRCVQCHGLGNVVGTPAGIQEGPDLIRAARRVEPGWAVRFILDPKKIDPKSRMTVPGLTLEQVTAIRDFVWTTSAEHGATPSAGGGQ